MPNPWMLSADYIYHSNIAKYKSNTFPTIFEPQLSLKVLIIRGNDRRSFE